MFTARWKAVMKQCVLTDIAAFVTCLNTMVSMRIVMVVHKYLGC